MIANMYPIAFVVSLATLTGWFYTKDDPTRSKFLKTLFIAAFAAFLGSWFAAEGAFSYKIGALVRELLVLSLLPAFLSIFRKNKLVFLALLFATLGGLKYFYFEKLTNTFPQNIETVHHTADKSSVVLDPDGELLVEILEGHSIDELKVVLQDLELIATRAFSPLDMEATDLDDYYLIDIPAAKAGELSSIKTALNQTGIVEWLEENEQIQLSPLETQPQRKLPKLNKKYGLNDPGLENLWGFEAMNVADLYDALKKVKPNKSALIAILDTGVDAGHEDLKANFKSVKSRYNRDKAGHGTHCAGIAAAVSNNNLGIASFSQNNDFVQVTSIKVLSDGGFGTQKMIIDGMLEAADAGADVLSLSLGGFSSDRKQRAYKKAVAYANKKGAIVVVAAGNSNQNAIGYAPANTPGVITVSAVDTLVSRASFSNIVKDLKMGIAAPGVKIYSTYPGSQYRTLNGTSMATPYVAGLVGLMKSIKPDIDTKGVYEILNKTGRQTKSGNETGKLIQPGAAIKELIR